MAALAAGIGAVSLPRIHPLALWRGGLLRSAACLVSVARLEEVVVSVARASSRGVPFVVPCTGAVLLEVSSQRGQAVNVHVVDAPQWTALQKAEGRLLNGRFHFDYPEFQALTATHARLSGQLLEGAYVIVVENAGVESGALKSDARVDVRVRR
jgi:hypothetical protein